MPSDWVLFGLIAALGIAGFNAYQKYAVRTDSPLTVSYQAQLFTLPPTALAAIVLAPNPLPSPTTIAVVTASGIVNAASFYLLAKALSKDDLSVISPIRSIVPVGVALVEPLVLDASYSLPVLVASVFACTGTYVILIEGSITTPLKRLRSKGVQLGLLSAVIIIAAVLLDRYGVTQTAISPTAYAFYLPLTTMIALIGFTAYQRRGNTWDALRPSLRMAPMGVFRSMNLLGAMAAFNLTTGTNATVLMRVGVLLTVVLGGSLFDEGYLHYRIAGAILLITGAALVAFLG